MEEPLPLSEQASIRLQQYPGVQTVALGPKEAGGRLTDRLAVLVLVRRKVPLAELAPEEILPAEIEGLPTDVVEVGEVYNLAAADTRKFRIDDTDKVRPLVGGTQIESLHWRITVDRGTLGCLALTKEEPRRVVMLSNAHVLGDSDSDLTDTVGQPTMCSICSDCCSDPVGEVLRFKKTVHVDGAIATVAEGIAYAAQIKEIGAVAGTRELSVADASSGAVQVQKRGRTTGLTFALVRGWVVGPQDIKNPNGSVNRTSRDHLMLQVRAPSECFALDGDSGSAVLDVNNKVVGLLFAANGKGNLGFACPIQFVTDELQIDILDATTVVPVVSEASPIPALAGIVHGPAGKLLETPAGRLAADLYDLHAPEVRRLVRTNPRASAVWRRHGGPALIHALARAAEEPDTCALPEELDGRPFAEQIGTIFSFFARYASEELRTAIERHASRLAACGGLTLTQGAALLAPGNPEGTEP